jgi:uncharacterized membrane protein YphA (DoxX/SURF4 family)
MNTMLSSVYVRIRTFYKLNLLVWLTRYLLAFAFIPSGMKKVLGQRFTSIGTDNPIGYFFEALFRSGMYWNFLGWGQLIAAILMMSQLFATLGNLIFFFIISNIFFITVSMHFTGTWLIALLMLFASTCLLLWDANRLQYIISKKGFLEISHDVTLPEASKIWQVSGILLFVESVSYTLIDNAIKTNHLQLFFVFFIAIIMTVAVTIILEYRNQKVQ